MLFCRWRNNTNKGHTKCYKKYNLDIPVFGMVKNDKHQTRALMDENRNELKISQNLKNLITKFQDTVHDTAIQYHRKLRDKEITKSELDNINGIGNIKKQALLKKFGSVEKIKRQMYKKLWKLMASMKAWQKNSRKFIKSCINHYIWEYTYIIWGDFLWNMQKMVFLILDTIQN